MFKTIQLSSQDRKK